MHQVKRRRAVLGADRLDRAAASMTGTDVVNVRAEQIPAGRPRLLRKGKDMNLMSQCQPGDEREKRGNDPVLSGSVHASGDDERDLHGARRWPARVFPAGGSSSFRASTA